jgi:ParB-like chromosome segregation protein Spo0J
VTRQKASRPASAGADHEPLGTDLGQINGSAATPKLAPPQVDARDSRQAARTNTLELAINNIVIPDGRRPVVVDEVVRLAESIATLGLQHPITVHARDDGKYELITGAHRLEAHRRLGRRVITATVVEMNETERRLWELGENLARSELTVQQRSEQIAEWVRLKKGAQIVQVSSKGGRGKQGGISAASRDLGINRKEIQRAAQIAEQTTPAAKAAARDAGLDNNQSALTAIARTPAREQVSKVAALAEKRNGKATLDAAAADNLIEECREASRRLVSRTIERLPMERRIPLLQQLAEQLQTFIAQFEQAPT